MLFIYSLIVLCVIGLAVCARHAYNVHPDRVHEAHAREAALAVEVPSMDAYKGALPKAPRHRRTPAMSAVSTEHSRACMKAYLVVLEKVTGRPMRGPLARTWDL